jgi:redox-sensing transcriptional repressor
VGQKINSLTVQPMEELGQTIREQAIRIGIITVPDSEAQNVADILVGSGIEAILNFAPVILKTPPTVRIHAADFTTDLQSLAYYLHDGKEELTDEQQ